MFRRDTQFHDVAMIRRLVALLLWSYFAWYLAATVASLTDGPSVAGPIAALLTAAIAAVGWVRSPRSRRTHAHRTEAHAAR